MSFFLKLFLFLICVIGFTCLQAQFNIAPSAAVSTSSNFGSGYTASDLVDGDTDPDDWSVGWYADFFGSGNPQSAEFDMGGTTRMVNRYDLYGHTNATVRPASHRFEGRVNSSDSWTVLNTVSTQIGAGVNSYSFSPSIAYRYYQVIMTDNGGASGTAGFQEVELYASTILPVEFIKVEVQNTHAGIQIEWWTAVEQNNDFFTIERSRDGTNWSKVGTVMGAGTSQTLQKYQFTDPFSLPGIFHYRVKQTDFDGKYDYSPTRFLIIENGEKAHLNFPNPAGVQEELKVQLGASSEEEIYTIQLVNVYGGGVYHNLPFSYDGDSYVVELDGLSIKDGVYFLRVATSLGVLSEKIHLLH